MTQNTDKGIARRVKQHVNARTHTFFAVVQPGFENTAKAELKEIGIESFGKNERGGVEFYSRLDGCYRANLLSRTITRILMRLRKFNAVNFDTFSKQLADFPWELYLSDKAVISFKISSSSSGLFHTGRIEDELKKAIEARLREYNTEVRFNKENGIPEQTVYARIQNNTCTLSLDSTGDLLYMRGRKTLNTEAPLRETLASLILMQADFLSYNTLIDPMCGSGTFSVEAASMAEGEIANIRRNFIFKTWPSFREPAYIHMLKNLSIKKSELIINTSDIDRDAVEIAGANILNAGLKDRINIQKADFFETDGSSCSGRILIVLNPPYGTRIRNFNVKETYRRIGETIREKYKGCGYAIITPDAEYEKIMSLSYDRKIRFTNGGIKTGVIFKK